LLESTRVKLSVLENEIGSDYINANYIGFENSKQYIACQAPLPTTTEAFWRMIWEKKSPVICMLTKLQENNRTKAHQYWPSNPDQAIQFGHFEVTLKSVIDLPHIDVRVFKVCSLQSGEAREITQLHYTEWSDFGVPQTTQNLRQLLKRT